VVNVDPVGASGIVKKQVVDKRKYKNPNTFETPVFVIGKIIDEQRHGKQVQGDADVHYPA
jgi:hypothetical protein